VYRLLGIIRVYVQISLALTRPPEGPRKIFNSKRGPEPKKFGNRCDRLWMWIVRDKTLKMCLSSQLSECMPMSMFC